MNTHRGLSQVKSQRLYHTCKHGCTAHARTLHSSRTFSEINGCNTTYVYNYVCAYMREHRRAHEPQMTSWAHFIDMHGHGYEYYWHLLIRCCIHSKISSRIAVLCMATLVWKFMVCAVHKLQCQGTHLTRHKLPVSTKSRMVAYKLATLKQNDLSEQAWVK